MEFREVTAILRRRWFIVVAVTGLAFLVAGVLAFRGPRAFEGTTRIVVSVGETSRPGETGPYPYYRDYYNWLSSEYLADDLSEIVKSDAFAGDVAAQLGDQISKSAIREVVRTRKTHRILEITVVGAQADQVRRMANGIADVIQQKGGNYLAQLAAGTGKIVVLDQPDVKPSTTTGSQMADIALRTLLGLLAGLFLAFAIDYIDPTIVSPREAERTLGLPILGEIPTAAH